VVDARSLAALYGRLGFRSLFAESGEPFDSKPAISVGYRVMRELAGGDQVAPPGYGTIDRRRSWRRRALGVRRRANLGRAGSIRGMAADDSSPNSDRRPSGIEMPAAASAARRQAVRLALRSAAHERSAGRFRKEAVAQQYRYSFLARVGRHVAETSELRTRELQVGHFDVLALDANPRGVRVRRCHENLRVDRLQNGARLWPPRVATVTGL
jgi:hypothetical protein